MTKAKTLP